MSTCRNPLVLVATLAVTACAAPPGINVGDEGDGSVAGRGGDAGASGFGGSAGFGGGADNALTAKITVPPSEMSIEVITIACSGDCKHVLAIATGGNGPYTFAWSDGVTMASREICADGDTAFSVSVSDTAIVDGEFPYAGQTATASLTADVLTCPNDGGVVDGGVPCATGAGHYVGTFTCLLGGAPFTGPIDLTLTSTAGGASLVVTGGHLSASAFGVVPFSADIVGAVDCATGRFAADLENGRTPASTFDGTMAGTYEPIGPALNGTWDLVSSTDPGTKCSGTWTTTLQP